MKPTSVVTLSNSSSGFLALRLRSSSVMNWVYKFPSLARRAYDMPSVASAWVRVCPLVAEKSFQ